MSNKEYWRLHYIAQRSSECARHIEIKRKNKTNIAAKVHFDKNAREILWHYFIDGLEKLPLAATAAKHATQRSLAVPS